MPTISPRSPFAFPVHLAAFALVAMACQSEGLPTVDGGATSADATVAAADASGATCTWGSVASCSCPNGGAGTQRCLSNGTYGPCSCGAVPELADAGSQAGSDGSAGPDLATDAAKDLLPGGGLDAAVDRLPDVAPDGAGTGFVVTRTMALAARQLVADTRRKVLYATLGGTAAMNANSLVVIDPVALTVKHAVPMGSDPGTMALSDDGSTLWVGLDGAFAVRRVDLTTSPPTAGAQYTLPKGDFGDTASAGPMAVLPGTTTSLAVSLHRAGVSPSFSGLAVLDDGVARMTKTRGHTGASRMVVGPTGWLFGYNNLHTGFGFYAVTVAATGVTQTEHSGLVGGFDTDIVYAANRVYATSGEVVDVSSPAKPVRAGKFGFAGQVIPRPAQSRVLMISGASTFDRTNATLRVLDPSTFTQVTSATITGVSEERVWAAVDLGGDTVAFLSSADRFSGAGSNKVHVLKSTLVGTP